MARAGCLSVKRYATYCMVCCFLVTSFICGFFVMSFIAQKRMQAAANEDPWAEFEKELESNQTEASPITADGEETTTAMLGVEANTTTLAEEAAPVAAVGASTTLAAEASTSLPGRLLRWRDEQTADATVPEAAWQPAALPTPLGARGLRAWVGL
mmetsp:Transcript_15266/g.47697  ORF Transcript_15266/g.47697 Transcript_15266/m.47697 type:complete len:155 (+) Transcript_15266:68-532(+)